jgi:hypothetical protein
MINLMYEGQFASPPIAQNLQLLAPFRSVTSGPNGWRSNTPGSIQARFGWGNSASGLVNNTRETAADALGVVIPLRSLNGANGGVTAGAVGIAGPQAAFTWQFYDPTVRGWRIRPGLGVTLHGAGAFWLRFPGGALYGQQVYASLTDGSAISGAAAGAEVTPWLVCSIARPGELALVSTAANFSA